MDTLRTCLRGSLSACLCFINLLSRLVSKITGCHQRGQLMVGPQNTGSGQSHHPFPHFILLPSRIKNDA